MEQLQGIQYCSMVQMRPVIYLGLVTGTAGNRPGLWSSGVLEFSSRKGPELLRLCRSSVESAFRVSPFALRLCTAWWVRIACAGLAGSLCSKGGLHGCCAESNEVENR
eukprot:scaffold340_cov256-Pinguiococcus_pyrenoidosus.AAC.40